MNLKKSLILCSSLILTSCLTTAPGIKPPVGFLGVYDQPTHQGLFTSFDGKKDKQVPESELDAYYLFDPPSFKEGERYKKDLEQELRNCRSSVNNLIKEMNR